MDDQRLEEIARKAKGQIQAALPIFECSSGLAYLNIMASVLEAVKVAIREALASQEEALRLLREERDGLLRQRDAVNAAMSVHQQTVTRAESAEAEVVHLKEQREDSVRRAKAVLDERNAVYAELQRLREWAAVVHDRFVQSEAQGFRSRDRQYAIDMLGKALEVVASPVEQKDTEPC